MIPKGSWQAVLAVWLFMASTAVAGDYNYVQRLHSHEDYHPSPSWTLTQWTGDGDSLEAAVTGAPDYDPAAHTGDALGWQQGYGRFVLDFGYEFTSELALWHFGGINWNGAENQLVYMRVSTDADNWSRQVRLRDVQSGGVAVHKDTYSLDTFGVGAARYLMIEKKSGGAKTGKFIDAAGVKIEGNGENRPPVAYAGPDRQADPGDEMALTATGSSDPDGADDLYSYRWEQISGRTVSFAGANTADPFVTIPGDAAHGERFTFLLTVTDRGGLSDSDEVAVTAMASHPPVASAGTDQRAAVGSRVFLDGTGSSDPDHDIAAYLWTQIQGPAVDLSDPSAVSPEFTAPSQANQTLTFELTVTDAAGRSSRSQVDVFITDLDAIYAHEVYEEEGCKSWVDRGPDLGEGALGAADFDPAAPGNQASGWDNNSGYLTLSFQRAFGAGEGHDLAVHHFGPGPAAVAVSADGAHWTRLGQLPVGTAGGDVLHTHKFDLDAYDLSEEWFQLVRIIQYPGGPDTGRFVDAVEAYYPVPAGNRAPVAVIFSGKTLEPGILACLDGSRSFDPEGDLVSHDWEQIQGPEVALSDAHAAKTYFSTPDATPHGTVLAFRLTVADRNGNPSESTAFLTVTANHSPTADAGADRKIRQGSRIRLDGSASADTDPGDGVVRYHWLQVSGPKVALSAEEPRPLILLPEDAAGQTLEFELTVTDGGGLIATDRVKVAVVNYDPLFASSVLSATGCKSWATRAADGGVNALGAPDYEPDTDGDQLSGWNYNNGQMTLEFRKNFVDGAGPDFAVYHFGPGPADLYVSGDGEDWHGPVELPPTAGGGGDHYTRTDFDLTAFGVAAAKFVRVVQTRPGKKTGRFIDAVEAFIAETGPDTLTVLEGRTCTIGEDAPAVSLIDTETDHLEWREDAGMLAVSAADALTPTFVAPAVDPGTSRDVVFSLYLNRSPTPCYQVRYTVMDNNITGDYLPATALPLTTPTEKRIGIHHDGDLVALQVLADDDAEIPDLPHKPRNFTFGLMDAAQRVPTPGARGEIRISFTTPLSEDFGWYGYNQQDGWYNFDRPAAEDTDGAEYSEDRTRVILHMTDGGGFDADGKTDGIITTCSGPALKGSQDAWLDKGGGSGGCFINALYW